MRKEKHIPPATLLSVNQYGDKRWNCVSSNGGHNPHRKEGPFAVWTVAHWNNDYCGFSCNVCYPIV